MSLELKGYYKLPAKGCQIKRKLPVGQATSEYC